MAFRSVLFGAVAALALAGTAGSAFAENLTISGQANRTGSGGEFIVTGFDSYYIPPAAVVT